MDKLDLPRSIGRMRTKLNTMSGFTAAELKSFTILLSCDLFEEVGVEEDALKIWRSFVEAMRFICKAVVMLEDLEKGQKKLLQFAKDLSQRYGNRSMKPNLHFAFHVVDCILDYGPTYVFQVRKL